MSHVARIALLSLACLTVFAQDFDFASYSERTFGEVIDAHAQDFSVDADFAINVAISAIPFKYKSKVRFSRVLREIPQERLAVIKGWGASLQQPADFVESYRREFLVDDDGMEIWLPMQEQILPFMGNELAAGDEFYVYYVVAGKYQNQWIFLGTEFQTQ